MTRGYRAIADELRGRIDSGEWPPGHRLPSENDLITAYGVEQQTARRALEVLKNEGLVAARRGDGTFVRAQTHLYRRRCPARLDESVWGAGLSVLASDVGDREVTVDELDVTTTTAPEHIRRALVLASRERAVMRRRRYLVDGRPVQLATSYYPGRLVRGTRIANPDTGPGGVYARLADLGHTPVRFREEVRARMPRSAESSSLGLVQGTPVVQVVRTAFTVDGRPVEVNEMTLDASVYILEYEFPEQHG